MISVLCVKYGNKYGVEYVEKLRNMLSRHLSIPYEFVCLTDDARPISGVRSIVQPVSNYKKMWWHKVHMFNPELDLRDRILYLDLDVIIHNNIDKLVDRADEEFFGIRDFNRKFHKSWNHMNSSVMSWKHRTQSEIYEKFQEHPNEAQRLHGDQDWIWKVAKHRVTFWPNEWIQSYKWEIRSKEELTIANGKRNFKNVRNDVSPHKDCCIAVFHGDPNPDTVNDSFVLENWK
jgi:hypothetical protein